MWPDLLKVLVLFGGSFFGAWCHWTAGNPWKSTSIVAASQSPSWGELWQATEKLSAPGACELCLHAWLGWINRYVDIHWSFVFEETPPQNPDGFKLHERPTRLQWSLKHTLQISANLCNLHLLHLLLPFFSVLIWDPPGSSKNFEERMVSCVAARTTDGCASLVLHLCNFRSWTRVRVELWPKRPVAGREHTKQSRNMQPPGDNDLVAVWETKKVLCSSACVKVVGLDDVPAATGVFAMNILARVSCYLVFSGVISVISIQFFLFLPTAKLDFWLLYWRTATPLHLFTWNVIQYWSLSTCDFYTCDGKSALRQIHT